MTNDSQTEAVAAVMDATPEEDHPTTWEIRYEKQEIYTETWKRHRLYVTGSQAEMLDFVRGYVCNPRHSLTSIKLAPRVSVADVSEMNAELRRLYDS